MAHPARPTAATSLLRPHRGDGAAAAATGSAPGATGRGGSPGSDDGAVVAQPPPIPDGLLLAFEDKTFSVFQPVVGGDSDYLPLAQSNLKIRHMPLRGLLDHVIEDLALEEVPVSLDVPSLGLEFVRHSGLLLRHVLTNPPGCDPELLALHRHAGAGGALRVVLRVLDDDAQAQLFRLRSQLAAAQDVIVLDSDEEEELPAAPVSRAAAAVAAPVTSTAPLATSPTAAAAAPRAQRKRKLGSGADLRHVEEKRLREDTSLDQAPASAAAED